MREEGVELVEQAEREPEGEEGYGVEHKLESRRDGRWRRAT